MNFKKQADLLYSKLIKEEVDGKIVYYRKRQVYPNLNEDGSINWFNSLVGGKWWNLILVLIIVLVSVGFFYEYHHNLSYCAEQLSKLNIKNITLP